MNIKFPQMLMALSVSALLTCSQAFAQTITQTNDFTLGPDDGGATLSPAIEFNSFNSSLGTLDEVVLTLDDVSYTGQLKVTNNYTSTESYTGLTMAASYILNDAAGGTSSNTISTFGSVNFANSTPVAPGGTYTSESVLSATDTVSSTMTDSTDLALYTGNGSQTVTLNLKDSLEGQVNLAPNNTTSEISTGTGVVELEYIYSPVPEPAETAGWVLGSCFVLILGRRYFKTIKTRLTPIKAHLS